MSLLFRKGPYLMPMFDADIWHLAQEQSRKPQKKMEKADFFIDDVL